MSKAHAFLSASAAHRWISKALINMEVAATTGGDALTDFARVCGITEKQFVEQWKSDPIRVFQLFIERLSQMSDEGISAVATLDEIGVSEIRLRDTINWMQGIKCLKSCGASIEDIQEYCRLCLLEESEENLRSRYAIIRKQREEAYRRLEEAKATVKYMEDMYFGVLLVLEKLFLLRWLKRLPAVLRHIYALVLVTISWTLFAFTEISKGAAWCKAMFSGVPFDSGSLYLLLTYGPMLAICALAATPLGKRFYEKLGTRLGQRALTVVDCGGLACVLVMAAAYLVSGSYNPFLYFRF